MLRGEFFKINSKFIKITSITDLKFEIHCMDFYMNMIKVLLAHSQSKTTLEEDLELLKATAQNFLEPDSPLREK